MSHEKPGPHVCIALVSIVRNCPVKDRYSAPVFLLSQGASSSYLTPDKGLSLDLTKTGVLQKNEILLHERLAGSVFLSLHWKQRAYARTIKKKLPFVYGIIPWESIVYIRGRDVIDLLSGSSFLTCGYTKRRNKLLRGLRYASESLTHKKVQTLLTDTEVITHPQLARV